MHILISAQTYPTPKAQLTAFLSVLAEEMVRQGMEVTVLAPQSLTTCWKHGIPLCPQKYEAEVEVKGGTRTVTILRPYSLTFGQGRLYRWSQIINKFVVKRAAGRLKRKPDVIYSHFWWSAENIVDYAVKKDIPLFVATGEHIINVGRHLNCERIKFVKKYTKGIVCVSTKNKEESIKCGLSDGNNTIVLPNAVNTTEFHVMDKEEVRMRLGFPQDTFIVAFCGRFGKRKGSGRLAEAIKLLGDDNIKSVFIGVPSEREKEKPDCPGILYMGGLQHEMIPAYLNASDVFVLPTLAEGCSNAIVEAMACGLPIISSDLSFNHDICTQDNSILVEPTDVHAIAEAIKKLKNTEIRRHLSEGALKTSNNLTIEKRVKKILEFMSEKCKLEES